MGGNAFANGRSISCKAADGKSICAFPDVCLSPPSPPAGPVPIPYPNTGMASDTSGGSKTVKIAGEEVMLKDSSYFKKSTGDEAATKSLGMGVVTHQIQGKVYFNSWSMDVKIEGQNVVRHLDLTTHNHASQAGNSPPWPYIDKVAKAEGGCCHGDVQREKVACQDCKPHGERDPCGDPPPKKPPALKALEAIPKGDRSPKQVAQLGEHRSAFAREQRQYNERKAKKNSQDPCLQARRCMLVPYKPRKRRKGRKRGEPGCCPGQTGHHLVEAASFLVPGTRKKGGVLKNRKWKYDLDRAPCVCAEGFDNTTATHGLMHTYQGVRAKKVAPNGKWKMKEAAETGAAAINMVFKGGCSQACLEQQIQAYHQKAGIKPDDEIDAAPSGRTDSQEAEAAWQKYDEMKHDIAKTTRRR